jgi:hypothetical protein
LLLDTEPEAAPARRLVAFGATFLGMLSLAQATFASGTPTLAPPVVMVVVLLGAAAGLLIWVRSRWSRGLLWFAAGLLLLASATTAVAMSTVAWVRPVLTLIGIAGFGAMLFLGIGQLRPKPGLAAWNRRILIVAVSALAFVTVVATPAGTGPRAAAIGSAIAMLLVWILRPED